MDQMTEALGPVAERFRSQVLEEMTAVARQRGLDLHPNEVSVLVNSLLPGMFANAAVAGLPKSNLERVLGGTAPVLFAYLPDVKLTSGVNVPAGCYAVTLDGRRRRAHLVGQDGKAVAELGLEVGSSQPSDVLARRAVVTDINGPELCTKVCVRVCLSVEVDLPGPFNPTVKVCIELIIEV